MDVLEATTSQPSSRHTFDAWKDYRRTGDERIYVGYSPIVAVDGAKILEDMAEAALLHVVRNPWSAYADAKKRAVPLSLEHYILGWTISQYLRSVSAPPKSAVECRS